MSEPTVYKDELKAKLGIKREKDIGEIS